MKLNNIILLVLVFVISFGITLIPNSYSESLPEVTVYSNPNVVNIGENSSIEIFIKNTANSTQIDAITIISPQGWPNNSTTRYPLVLNQNSIQHSSITLHIPYDTKDGNYNIVVVAKTPAYDVLGQTSIQIKTIQSFPLSGDIPISVIAILVPGFTTYSIIVLILTRKYERNFPEMLLVGITFGIIMWYSIGKTIDQIPKSGLTDYVRIAGISIVTGLAFALLIKGVKKLNEKLTKNKRFQKIRNSLILEGFAKRDEQAWATYIGDQLSLVKKNFGKRYSLKMKIVLKNPTNNIREGILWHYNDGKPYDVALHPKHVHSCNTRKDFVNTLLKKSSLLSEINENGGLRKLLSSHLKCDNNSEQVLNSLEQKLSSGSTDEFKDLLQKLDFSNYVFEVIEALGGVTTKTGDNPSFTPENNMSSVEILGYETAYAVKLQINGNFVEIPEVFEPKYHRHVKKRTLL